MKTYTYDGSIEGLLCAFKTALAHKDTDASFARSDAVASTLFSQDAELIEPSPAEADELLRRLRSIFPEHSLHSIFNAFISEADGVEDSIYRVLAESISRRQDILQWPANSDAARIREISRRVSGEIHRFKGILRFSQLDNGSLVAKFAPDYNIIVQLARHFKSRLRNEKWMVLDEKRLLAVLHEPDKDIRPATIAEIKEIISANPASGEIETRQLWRNFFSSIAIPERRNPELQKRCLPQRYWNYLVETPAGDEHRRER